MARFFMGDTSLAGLERMMMDSSRRSVSDDRKPSHKAKKAPPTGKARKEPS